MQRRLFQNSWGFGVGGEEVMQRHACGGDVGRNGGRSEGKC